METKTYHSVDPSATKLWRISGAIGTLVFIGIALFVYFVVYEHLWIFLIPLLIGIGPIFIFPAIEYRQWKYWIGDDRVEIIHGIFFVKRIILPINRIQHLKIRQGILQKQFDLASVDLFTAGGNHGIEALPMAVAEEIALHLNRVVVEEGELHDS